MEEIQLPSLGVCGVLHGCAVHNSIIKPCTASSPWLEGHSLYDNDLPLYLDAFSLKPQRGEDVNG